MIYPNLHAIHSARDVLAALLFTAAFAPAHAAPTPIASGPKIPYTFEQNRGQAHPEALFQARGEGYSLYLTAREAVLSVAHPGRDPHAFRMSLKSALAPKSIEPLDEQPQRSNYFLGNDPAQWRTGVPHFARIRYSNVYERIDLVYHSAADRLEYDFIVQPGADAGAIRMKFAGAEEIPARPKSS